MNKKILFLCLFTIFISILTYSSEKIVDLKESSMFAEITFTPVNENGEKIFGHYLAKVFLLRTEVTDNTTEELSGKIDEEKIKFMARYYSDMRFHICLMVIGSIISIPLGCIGLYKLYTCESSNFLPGILLTAGSIIGAIIFIIGTGFLIYTANKYYIIKKEIINLLNGIPTSEKSDSIRIKFCFNVTF